MKRLFGMLAVALLCATTAFAQTGRRGGGMPAGQRTQQLAKFKKDLKLSDEQTTKFDAAYTQYYTDMKAERQAMRSAKSTDRSAMRSKMQAIRSKRDASIKQILSADQYKTYESEMKTSHRSTSHRQAKK